MTTLTMTTCRLLYALLVLALCCCSSVCATKGSGDPNKDSGSATAQPQEAGGAGLTNPSMKSSLTDPTDASPKPENPDGEELAPAGNSGTGGPETIPKAKPGASDGSGLSGGSANPDAASSSVTASVSAQSQMENAPTTTTTTTTKAPSTTTTTTTEAPTTTTTRAPSLLREIDGSLSSSAWVCFPLLLAASALAYTAVG
ncbi:mucin TcMUCII [Trypanosoma cruzi cruzi]|uniref:Putative mucin TcMUCII n=1 Tax=Trypanosoma cruzi TaxID=5693 RepID=A0A2V2US11_TRYCR|nr:mucin TcMUCII [Trypanosoma cruzi cruzi]PWU86006.1 putative mucin TcMUCII [Trypanosoma cruzi]